MATALYWIGLAHVVAYLMVGSTAVLIWAVNTTYRRLKLTSTILKMHIRVIQERRTHPTDKGSR